MNQILQVQENRKKSNNSKPIDTKKIVLFFAICLIIFGAILLGQGGYAVYQVKLNEKVTPSIPGDNTGDVETPEYLPPIVTLTKTDDNKVIINVESEIAISYIIYDWNNGVAQTLDEVGKTNIEEIIDIPAGENILNVSIIDCFDKSFRINK